MIVVRVVVETITAQVVAANHNSKSTGPPLQYDGERFFYKLIITTISSAIIIRIVAFMAGKTSGSV